VVSIRSPTKVSSNLITNGKGEVGGKNKKPVTERVANTDDADEGETPLCIKSMGKENLDPKKWKVLNMKPAGRMKLFHPIALEMHKLDIHWGCIISRSMKGKFPLYFF
jgi:hypothetical protein